MIKYYEELEHRNEYYLPLIEENIDNKHKLSDLKLTSSFYYKHKELFSCSQVIIIEFKKLDFEFVLNMYKLGMIDYNLMCDITGEIDSINEESYLIEIFNDIDFSSNDFYYYIDHVIHMANVLSLLYVEKSNYYKNIVKSLSNVKKEMDSLNTIILNESKTRNYYLPDAWFITPFGDLYNTGGPRGHKQTNLIYAYSDVCSNIDNEVDFSLKHKKLLEERNKIAKNGYVTLGDFIIYLNLIYSFATLDMKKAYIDNTTYDKRIVDIVRGVVGAQTSFYRFFSILKENTNNPKAELERLRKLTGSDIKDILVRCCGLHKVETTVEKTITTSCLNYEVEFSEYIKRGWKIVFVAPIIVQRDLGTISKLDMDSLFVKRYIKKNCTNDDDF